MDSKKQRRRTGARLLFFNRKPTSARAGSVPRFGLTAPFCAPERVSPDIHPFSRLSPSSQSKNSLKRGIRRHGVLSLRETMVIVHKKGGKKKETHNCVGYKVYFIKEKIFCVEKRPRSCYKYYGIENVILGFKKGKSVLESRHVVKSCSTLSWEKPLAFISASRRFRSR